LPEHERGFGYFNRMAEPRRRSPALSLLPLVIALLIAAIIGGIVARLLPVGAGSTQSPALVAAPNDVSLAPLIKKTAPAVVTIAVLQPSPAQQNPLLQDPFFRRYFGVPDAAALQPTVAAGSGVIVDGKRGLVITNFHVVQKAQAVEVGLKDGRKVAAQPVALAPKLDLAVLRIDAKDLPQLELGDSDKLDVGDYVDAIGNPFRLGQPVPSGIVSATSRPLVANDPRRFIQTDAPINPGNSGGPLIDLDGRIVGINSALFSPNGGEGNVGIGFAIPSNVVKKLLSSIRN
jgi:S1-C subfamily serine protease